jgi:hypothetical protein
MGRACRKAIVDIGLTSPTIFARLARLPIVLFDYERRIHNGGKKMADLPHNPLQKAMRINLRGTTKTFQIAATMRHLYTHLLENGHVVPIRNYSAEHLSINPDGVLRRIQSSDDGWERVVPPAVVEIIRRERLFGYRSK